MDKFVNGYPSLTYLYHLCDMIKANRLAIIPCAEYGESSGVIYYKSEISKRSINTFAKFLIHEGIHIESWDDKKIKIKQLQDEQD